MNLGFLESGQIVIERARPTLSIEVKRPLAKILQLFCCLELVPGTDIALFHRVVCDGNEAINLARLLGGLIVTGKVILANLASRLAPHLIKAVKFRLVKGLGSTHKSNDSKSCS